MPSPMVSAPKRLHLPLRGSTLYDVTSDCMHVILLIKHPNRLAATAFRNVLSRKQSNYREVIAWLDVAIRKSAPSCKTEASRLNRIAKHGEAVFRGYKF